MIEVQWRESIEQVSLTNTTPTQIVTFQLTLSETWTLLGMIAGVAVCSVKNANHVRKLQLHLDATQSLLAWYDDATHVSFSLNADEVIDLRRQVVLALLKAGEDEDSVWALR